MKLNKLQRFILSKKAIAVPLMILSYIAVVNIFRISVFNNSVDFGLASLFVDVFAGAVASATLIWQLSAKAKKLELVDADTNK